MEGYNHCLNPILQDLALEPLQGALENSYTCLQIVQVGSYWDYTAKAESLDGSSYFELAIVRGSFEVSCFAFEKFAFQGMSFDLQIDFDGCQDKNFVFHLCFYYAVG